jgi:hypothetical protein
MNRNGLGEDEKKEIKAILFIQFFHQIKTYLPLSSVLKISLVESLIEEQYFT